MFAQNEMLLLAPSEKLTVLAPAAGNDKMMRSRAAWHPGAKFNSPKEPAQLASLIDDVTDLVVAGVGNDLPSHAIAQQILDHIAQHPDAVGELYPGMVLSRRKMTPAERAAMSLPTANRTRMLKEQERRREIRALIETIRRSKPAITDKEIAERLNVAGIRPIRGPKWNIPRVRNLLDADQQPIP